MQEVVQIQSIAAGFSIGEILRSVVDARERHALRSRILRRVELWRTAFGVAKEYCWTWTFRHVRFAKQGAGHDSVPRSKPALRPNPERPEIWFRNRHRRRRADVGLTSSAHSESGRLCERQSCR